MPSPLAGEVDAKRPEGTPSLHCRNLRLRRSFDPDVRHPVGWFGIAVAILVAGASILFLIPALADLLPHDPSSCGGG